MCILYPPNAEVGPYPNISKVGGAVLAELQYFIPSTPHVPL